MTDLPTCSNVDSIPSSLAIALDLRLGSRSAGITLGPPPWTTLHYTLVMLSYTAVQTGQTVRFQMPDESKNKRIKS